MGTSGRGCFVHVLAMQESEADIGTIFYSGNHDFRGSGTYAVGSRCNSSTPELRRCGLVEVAITKEGGLEAAMFGPLLVRPQTVPNASTGPSSKSPIFAKDSITVLDDCQGVVDGAKLARVEAESARRQRCGSMAKDRHKLGPD